MAVIVTRGNARVTWLTGLASLRSRACGMARRAAACAATAILVCAVGAALLQLAAQILSLSAPIAVTGLTVMAAALLNSLRRHLRAQASRRHGPANPRGV
ncbi:MAG TPA: hypothetical protein VEF71_15545 [Streptosporangiaceae bacterium]|nr:hypothetical protein [Streptosporangiaceae bacterium]